MDSLFEPPSSFEVLSAVVSWVVIIVSVHGCKLLTIVSLETVTSSTCVAPDMKAVTSSLIVNSINTDPGAEGNRQYILGGNGIVIKDYHHIFNGVI